MHIGADPSRAFVTRHTLFPSTSVSSPLPSFNIRKRICSLLPLQGSQPDSRGTHLRVHKADPLSRFLNGGLRLWGGEKGAGIRLRVRRSDKLRDSTIRFVSRLTSAPAFGKKDSRVALSNCNSNNRSEFQDTDHVSWPLTILPSMYMKGRTCGRLTQCLAARLSEVLLSSRNTCNSGDHLPMTAAARSLWNVRVEYSGRASLPGNNSCLLHWMVQNLKVGGCSH
jgi:hypothetical protein